MSTPKGFS